MQPTMGEHSSKRQVVIYLPYDLHKELKKLAVEQDTTISELVERSTRRMFRFAEKGLIAAESSPPYGRKDAKGDDG